MEKNSFTFNFSYISRSLVLMFIFFLIFELTTRLVWKYEILGPKLYKLDTTYNYGYEFKKNMLFRKNNSYFSYPTEYFNIHPQSIPQKKEKNEFRIFTYGGSVSRGHKDSHYTCFLKETFQQSNPQSKISAINFSADGFGSKRMSILIKNSSKYNPDFVIIHVHGSNEYEDERDLKYKREINSGVNSLLYKSKFIVLSKKIYSRLIERNNAVIDANEEKKASKNNVNVQRWNQLIETNLDQMIKLLTQNNVKILLIGRAERNYQGSNFSNKKTVTINQIIKQYADHENVYYFDTPQILLKKFPNEQDKDIVFIDNTHFTKKAHQYLASEIAKIIGENKIIAY